MLITKTQLRQSSIVTAAAGLTIQGHSRSSWTSLFISNVHSVIFDDLYDFIM